jgi:hypothetical protein
MAGRPRCIGLEASNAKRRNLRGCNTAAAKLVGVSKNPHGLPCRTSPRSPNQDIIPARHFALTNTSASRRCGFHIEPGTAGVGYGIACASSRHEHPGRSRRDRPVCPAPLPERGCWNLCLAPRLPRRRRRRLGLRALVDCQDRRRWLRGSGRRRLRSCYGMCHSRRGSSLRLADRDLQ